MQNLVPMMARVAVVVVLAVAIQLVSIPPAGAGPSTPPAGGAGPRASLEGCMGQWLFNGIWRLRVLKLERIRKPGSGDPGTPGWGLTTEIRNGSKKTLSMAITGIDGGGSGVDLVLPDGNTLELAALDFQKIVYKDIPQGGGVVHQLKYYYDHGTPDSDVQQPAKFLVEINPQQLRNYRGLTAGAAYSVRNPSFRVRLDCTK